MDFKNNIKIFKIKREIKFKREIKRDLRLKNSYKIFKEKLKEVLYEREKAIVRKKKEKRVLVFFLVLFFSLRPSNRFLKAIKQKGLLKRTIWGVVIPLFPFSFFVFARTSDRNLPGKKALILQQKKKRNINSLGAEPFKTLTYSNEITRIKEKDTKETFIKKYGISYISLKKKKGLSLKKKKEDSSQPFAETLSKQLQKKKNTSPLFELIIAFFGINFKKKNKALPLPTPKKTDRRLNKTTVLCSAFRGYAHTCILRRGLYIKRRIGKGGFNREKKKRKEYTLQNLLIPNRKLFRNKYHLYLLKQKIYKDKNYNSSKEILKIIKRLEKKKSINKDNKYLWYSKLLFWSLTSYSKLKKDYYPSNLTLLKEQVGKTLKGKYGKNIFKIKVTTYSVGKKLGSFYTK